MAKPDLSQIPSFYHAYLRLVEEETVADAIRINTEKGNAFLHAIEEEKWTFRYAADKWSIKEVVQHIIDTERIFSYRSLCIARGEKQSLPGFDEKQYAALSNANNRTAHNLLAEWDVVRKSTAALFSSFDEEQLSRTGIANNKPVSVSSIGFIMAGHVQHHLLILRERYLV